MPFFDAIWCKNRFLLAYLSRRRLKSVFMELLTLPLTNRPDFGMSPTYGSDSYTLPRRNFAPGLR